MKLILITLLFTYLALVIGSGYPPPDQGNQQSAYGAPSTQGNEQSAYGAPSTQGNQQSAYPSQPYGAPSTQGNEQSAYGAPSTQGNQQSGYGAPSSQGEVASAICQANLFSGVGLPMASNDCNDKGYCIPGSVDTDFRGCSCFSGWDGEDCKRERDTYSCVADQVRPDVSSFDTTIGGFMDAAGRIILTLRAPIENTIDDDKDNYATYTKLRFKNEDRCDYPEGVDTEWMKLFDNKACYETYNGTTSVADLIKCTGEYVNCYDAQGAKIDCARPELCINKPCNRCYDANLLATRGYVRTTENRDLTATATAENCHYFRICLPWILNVESNMEVTPIQNFEFVIIRVAFSCFSTYATDNCNANPLHNWIVEIESTVHYPWFVKERSTDSAKLVEGNNVYDMVELLQVSGCNDPTKDCVQRFRFEIPGCSTLEDQKLYQIKGLQYDCFGDCANAKDELVNAGLLDVQAQMTLQATQDNCGLDFMIDGTDTVQLKMNPYLEDYVTPNAVFIEGDDKIGFAYFKIIADSNLDIKQFNLIKVTSQKESDVEITLGENAPTHGYMREDCPAAATEGGKDSICFKALVTSLYTELDPESPLVSVQIHADVEVLFTDGSKRTVGLGNNYDLNTKVNVAPNSDGSSTSSATALAVASSFILAAF